MTAREVYELWLDNVTNDERAQMEKMSEEEIMDAFSGPLSFGTAGMRGTLAMGLYRMNNYMVRRATAGVAEFVKELGQEAMAKGVVISYDTRRFSKEFALASAEVLAKQGVAVYIFENVRPVPMCSFAVRYFGATCGIMITASHNPKEYNGYKVYGSDGAQMSPEDTAVVVSYIDKIDNPFSIERESLTTKIEGLDNQKIHDYVTVIGKSVDQEYYSALEKLALSPDAVAEYGKKIKLVYTPIHGSGAVPVATILNRIGIKANIVEAQEKPDGDFSTVAVPNPENKDTLTLGIKLADKIKADVVIGTDPDADRMGVAVRDDSEQFVSLTGNQIGALLFDYIASRLNDSGKLTKRSAMVRSFVSTSLADKIADKYGIKTFIVPTGFKFIGEKIKEWEENGRYEFVFGFEESFGSLRGTHSRDKDAVVATMLFAEMTCYYMTQGKTVYKRLQEIFAEYGYYVEKNVTIAYKGYDAMKDMARGMDKLRAKHAEVLGGERVEQTSDYQSGITYFFDGRMEMVNMPKSNTMMYVLADGQFVCVRPSGTEPKLKLYVLAKADSKDGAVEKAEKMMASAQLLLN